MEKLELGLKKLESRDTKQQGSLCYYDLSGNIYLCGSSCCSG